MTTAFRGVVEREIERAGGKKSDAYKAVAVRTGLGYDYIYQLYTGKSGQRHKAPGAAAYDALVRAYLNDEDFEDLFTNAPRPSSAPTHFVIHRKERVERSKREVTDSQWALLEDFELLPEEEKVEIREMMKSHADNIRALVNRYLKEKGISSTPVDDFRVEAAYGPPPPPPPPPPPSGPSSWKKITPVPDAPKPKTKVK